MMKPATRARKRIGAPLLLCDAHYIRGAMLRHDVLLDSRPGSAVDDENQMRFADDEFYLKSESEMMELSRAL